MRIDRVVAQVSGGASGLGEGAAGRVIRLDAAIRLAPR